nr:hypothetical protein HAGR004_09870 [Bdellovibrio sp. HAGR004]
MHKLTTTQQAELLTNPNVQKITDGSVVYTPSFKIKATKSYLGGANPDQIFREAGIPPELFKNDYCRSCLKRWADKYKSGGSDALKEDKRGLGSPGRPRSENLDELTYEELKALVEIQKGVIDDLVKKRALAKKKR